VIRRALAGTGHDLAEAEHAEAALVALAAAPADVVFCDVQMPGEDGLWLTARIRSLYPTTAVILATGSTNVEPRMSMQAGVVAYLVKPFTRESLLDALDVALTWHADVQRTGLRAEDSGDTLKAWLDSLDVD
jgi:CheY-like chemotaxis protein